MTSNQISLRKVKEDERHNRATEAEERRHNVTTETYTAEHYEKSDQAALQQAWASASQAETAKGNMAINAINAETQRYVAETGRMSYLESSRHNVAAENESIRHNKAVEQEDYRHNVKSESNELIKARAAESQAYSESKRVNAYIALTAAQVEDMLVAQLRDRKMTNAQIEHLQNQDLYDQRRAETDRLKALADAEYKAQDLAIRREQMNFNWSQLDLDRYKANLEGLKIKKDQNPKKDSGGGIFTGLRNIGDSFFQLFN